MRSGQARLGPTAAPESGGMRVGSAAEQPGDLRHRGGRERPQPQRSLQFRAMLAGDDQRRPGRTAVARTVHFQRHGWSRVLGLSWGFAGGRCWVRTNVGLADGFTDIRRHALDLHKCTLPRDLPAYSPRDAAVREPARSGRQEACEDDSPALEPVKVHRLRRCFVPPGSLVVPGGGGVASGSGRCTRLPACRRD